MLDGELKDEFVAVSRLADARCFIVATFLLFVPPASVMSRSPTGNTRFTNSAINHSGQKPGDRGHTACRLLTLLADQSPLINVDSPIVVIRQRPPLACHRRGFFHTLNSQQLTRPPTHTVSGVTSPSNSSNHTGASRTMI